MCIYQRTKELHVVDYKSTSNKTKGKSVSQVLENVKAPNLSVSLGTKEAGFSGILAIFCIVMLIDLPQHHSLEKLRDNGLKVSLLDYSADCSWIEPTLMAIRKLLDSRRCPKHDEKCEYGVLRECEVLCRGLINLSKRTPFTVLFFM